MGYYGPITLRVDRRALLLGVTALAGCGQLGNVGAVVDKTGPLIDSLRKAADDVSLISSGLAPIVAVIRDKVDPAVVQQVVSAVGVISQAATDLGKTTDAAAGQFTVSRVVSAVGRVTDLVAPFLAGTPYGQALIAAKSLLPVVQAAVGFVTSHLGQSAMAPDQARLVLRRSAGR